MRWRDCRARQWCAGAQIGGVRTLRDFPGSGRDPLQPVPPAQQREALDLLASGVLAPDSLPPVGRAAAPPGTGLPGARGRRLPRRRAVATDFSLAQSVLDLQRALLSQLMSDALAARILDSEPKSARSSDAFHLAELYERLGKRCGRTSAVATSAAAARCCSASTSTAGVGCCCAPAPTAAPTPAACCATQAQALLGRITRRCKRGGLSPESRAHLQDSADSLTQALAAPLQRAGR
jgi:hypothetical protein